MTMLLVAVAFGAGVAVGLVVSGVALAVMAPDPYVLRAAYGSGAIARTLRHDYDLLEEAERKAVLTEAQQIYEHHVQPILDTLAPLPRRHR